MAVTMTGKLTALIAEEKVHADPQLLFQRLFL